MGEDSARISSGVTVQQCTVFVQYERRSRERDAGFPCTRSEGPAADIAVNVGSGSDRSGAGSGDSPPDRIRIERFGKSSIVLARCKDADQTAYEPLFKSAAGLFSTYRKALDTAKIVPVDLAKTASVVPAPAKSASVPVKKSTTKK
jgi:hypothetical protein